MKAKIVEKRTVTGQYDIDFDQMIVDHPEHGRLFLSEGFGGLDSLEGGAYRWKHGLAIALKKDDTFDSLECGEWNEIFALYEAVMQGYDDSRPILPWSGYAIKALADGAE